MVRRKSVKETVAVGEVIGNAAGDIRSLADEMQEWQGNMEGTGLENTQKFETVSEAADVLEEQASELEDLEGQLSKFIEAHPTFDASKVLEYTMSVPYSKYESRPTRLQRVICAIDTLTEHLEGSDDEDDESDDSVLIGEIRGDLENVSNELQGVDLPGMF